MEINKILVMSFEGDNAVTEQKYFDHFKIDKHLAFELFDTNIIRFQCHRLEKGANYKKIIPRWLSNISNLYGYQIFLIIDHDKKESIDLFLKQLPEIKEAIIDAAGDRIENPEEFIKYLALPEDKAFEYFLRLHFEKFATNLNDNDFIKTNLGEKYKKQNDNYPQKLWKTTQPSVLLDNLRNTKCDYLEMFAKNK